jgi:hypothetical protein
MTRSDARSNSSAHLAHTHGTGLTTRVEHTTTNLIWRELADRPGHEITFSVGRGISIRVDAVDGRQNDVAVEDEQGTKRMIADGPCLASQCDRLSREAFVRLHTEVAAAR